MRPSSSVFLASYSSAVMAPESRKLASAVSVLVSSSPVASGAGATAGEGVAGAGAAARAGYFFTSSLSSFNRTGSLDQYSRPIAFFFLSN